MEDAGAPLSWADRLAFVSARTLWHQINRERLAAGDGYQIGPALERAYKVAYLRRHETHLSEGEEPRDLSCNETLLGDRR